MSEQLMVCKALAAMMGSKGSDLSEEEINFVGHAVFEMALSPEESKEVEAILKEGGDYDALLKDVSSKQMRTFLFRRVVAAVLLDEQVDDDEKAIIDSTAKAFDYTAELVEEYLAWMKEGIAWEKRGAELMAKM